jgi:tRNA (guanosine-2'-O-)-methyltransferase
MVQKPSIPSFDYHVPSNLFPYCGELESQLGGFISLSRMAKMKSVLQNRSRRVLTVFENTHHAHNISAILRSIDVFGFLDLFFVYSNPNMRFRAADTIDRGASQWLFPKRLINVAQCAQMLKANGYKIALVTLPDFSRTADNYQNQLPAFSSAEFQSEAFHQFLGDEKIALVFGSELIGVSQEWNDYADMYFYVQMFGFSESLNVSVCAAILLQSLRQSYEIRKKEIGLTSLEKQCVLEHWIAKDYVPSRVYLASRAPELIPWFEFAKDGRFFSLAQNNGFPPSRE